MSAAGYRVEDGVAVVQLENPPVNALSLPLRLRLARALEAAQDDAAVNAIVLTGAGRGFCGGGDLNEFDGLAVWHEPTPPALCLRIERSAKPVVAALHGLALGGGLELALACHGRVAQTGTQIGLPEVKLGLVPGAGGTQRLPRLVGLERALDLIVTGRSVTAQAWADSGLFDRVCEGEPLPDALALARQLAAQGRWPRTGERDVGMENAEAFLAFARATAAARQPSQPAPVAGVDCLVRSVTLPLDQGLEYELDTFHRLRGGAESAALRHAFAAERQAREVAGLAPGTRPRAIERVAVVGGGTMGTGIALSLAQAGLPVTVIERTPEAAAQALQAVRHHIESAREKGRLTSAQASEQIVRVAAAADYAPVRQAQLVIEAVFEDLAVKQSVFEQLDALALPGTLLATNTSMLDVDRIAAFTGRAQDVLGLHFFSPAHVMPLLEVVRGAKTAPEVLASAMALAQRLGKTAVVSGVCEGFIGNRMLQPYLTQAGLLLDEGALPQQVDQAIERWGFAMGPFRMSDMAGNDLGAKIRAQRMARHPGLVESGCFDAIVALGRHGQKAGRGWYDYLPGQRKPMPSDEVAAVVQAQSARLGLARRRIADEEIVERLLLALVNEGARILEEGIAQRASDLDVVYLAGYGFPRWRGGPMFAAARRGWGDVLAALQRQGRHGPAYQRRHEFWRPAAAIERWARGGAA